MVWISLGGEVLQNRSVLAIGAHPDDIELGCGGTLSKLMRRGIHIRALVLTSGSRGSVVRTDRAAETKAAFATLGIDDVHVHDFEDTHLSQHFDDAISLIEKHVREIKPVRAYTMFDKDRHQDHEAAHKASLIACRSVPQLIGYETPSSYANFTPTLFECVCDVFPEKLQAIKLHKSQNNKDYMQEESLRAVAQFRGIQAGRFCLSEGFIPYRLSQ